jgi:magnesium-transporting ATPase (P-type)
VTIPEGVKLAETLAISSSLNKLFDRNSLIRSLNALEVMARCTDICVETTGCLTDTKINIDSVHLGGIEPIPIFETKKMVQHKNARQMLETILFSSSCFYELINHRDHQISGQETEIGLIKMLTLHMQRWIYESRIREILDQNKLAR